MGGRHDIKAHKTLAFATAAAIPLIMTGDLQAQQQPPQFPNMTFFIASTGATNGADFGGLEGADKHCQALAAKAGAGARTWRAYLSVQAEGNTKVINARDRIGNGPWVNASGVQIAANVADLHADGNKINEETGLSENGRKIPGGPSWSISMTSSPDRNRTGPRRLPARI